MEPRRFDAIARIFARRISRRSAVAAGGTGLRAAVLGTVDVARAQEATPGSADPTTSAAEHGGTLFARTADGAFRPNPPGAPVASPGPERHGASLLTLESHNGETSGFSDRPPTHLRGGQDVPVLRVHGVHPR